jgi:hypothetical protein
MAIKYERPDEWEENFRKWNIEKRKKLEKPLEPFSQQIIEIKPHLQKSLFESAPSTQVKEKYVLKIFLLSLLVLIIVLLEYFALKASSSTTSFVIFTVFLFVASSAFFIILLAHKVYEKSTKFINPRVVLAGSYALIVVNMLLSPRIYSPEWAFLGFLIITIIFYDFKIDSRFLILPALFLLGYIPFLLIGAQKEIAETVAIYVYYFLVVGVALQITEYYRQIKNSVDLDDFVKKPIAEQKMIYALSIFGIIVITAILINRFYSIELLKWSLVYIFFVLLIIYGIFVLQGQKKHTPA